MSGGHDHNHNHHHFQSSQARLRVAFWTQAAFFVVELVGGILSNSLALLADAGGTGRVHGTAVRRFRLGRPGDWRE